MGEGNGLFEERLGENRWRRMAKFRLGNEIRKTLEGEGGKVADCVRGR